MIKIKENGTWKVISGSGTTGDYVDTSSNQTINGVKNFTSTPTVNGTGVATASDITNTVKLTGDQTIAGVKTFSSTPTVNGTNVALVSAIPTKTSELTNDSGYITSSSIPTYYQHILHVEFSNGARCAVQRISTKSDAYTATTWGNHRSLASGMMDKSSNEWAVIDMGWDSYSGWYIHICNDDYGIQSETNLTIGSWEDKVYKIE